MIELRKVELNDLEEIIQLEIEVMLELKEIIGDTFPAFDEENNSKMNILTILDGNCGFAFCAVDTKIEKIVGICLALDGNFRNIDDGQHEKTLLMLMTVFVDKDYRNNGIGKNLIKTIEKKALEYNYISINTTLYVPNTIGQTMLSKMGYIIAAEERIKMVN